MPRPAAGPGPRLEVTGEPDGGWPTAWLVVADRFAYAELPRGGRAAG